MKRNFELLLVALAFCSFSYCARAESLTYTFAGVLFDASDATKDGLGVSGSILVIPELLTEVYDASSNERSGFNAPCAACRVVSSAAVSFSDGSTMTIGSGTYNSGEISIKRNWTSRATGHTAINYYEIGSYENPVIDGSEFTYNKGVQLIGIDYMGLASPMFHTNVNDLDLSQDANFNYGSISAFGYVGGDDWSASIRVSSIMLAVDEPEIGLQISVGLLLFGWSSRRRILSGIKVS